MRRGAQSGGGRHPFPAGDHGGFIPDFFAQLL